MIHEVHALGGFVIMSHPIQYPDSFFRYCHLLDGYEYRNGNRDPFDKGKTHIELCKLHVRPFNNSDFHFEGESADAGAEILQCNYYENEVLDG